MKTFSDLLATDHYITVRVTLKSIKHNGAPGATVRVNNMITEFIQLTETSVVTEYIDDLSDPIDIEISMCDKIYDEHKETAVIIDSISIDGFEIVPNWTHLAEYNSERGPQGPTSYLGFNGSWRLHIDQPFYQWRHRVTGQGWLLEPIETIDGDTA